MIDVQVLARIDSAQFWRRDEAYREEIRAWLRANGIDPLDVSCGVDVEVLVLGAPAVRRLEYIRDPASGRMQRDPDDPEGILGRVVHSLLLVPLPDHLADPT